MRSILDARILGRSNSPSLLAPLLLCVSDQDLEKNCC